jgi:NADPH:quinone reductase-like Zn-dependent oxidoreductase
VDGRFRTPDLCGGPAVTLRVADAAIADVGLAATPVISRTYPLDEAASALRDEDEGHGSGKVVITV